MNTTLRAIALPWGTHRDHSPSRADFTIAGIAFLSLVVLLDPPMSLTYSESNGLFWLGILAICDALLRRVWPLPWAVGVAVIFNGHLLLQHDPAWAIIICCAAAAVVGIAMIVLAHNGAPVGAGDGLAASLVILAFGLNAVYVFAIGSIAAKLVYGKNFAPAVAWWYFGALAWITLISYIPQWGIRW